MFTAILLLFLLDLASADCITTCATSAEYCGVGNLWLASCKDACSGGLASLESCSVCFARVSDVPGKVAECVMCYYNTTQVETCDWNQVCKDPGVSIWIHPRVKSTTEWAAPKCVTQWDFLFVLTCAGFMVVGVLVSCAVLLFIWMQDLFLWARNARRLQLLAYARASAAKKD